MKSNFKSMFATFATFALAAVTLLAANTCSAAILIKPKATTTNKSSVTVTWSAYKGAKSYSVLRATRKNINYAKVVKKSTKSRKFVDKKVKLGYNYYYWVVPNVKNANKNLFSSSQSKKCAWGCRYFFLECSYWNPEPKKLRVGKKLKFGLLVNGKEPLSKYGLKCTVKTSGALKWHKKTGKKGMLGYFTSSKKGAGYFKSFKVGNMTWTPKTKITWY